MSSSCPTTRNKHNEREAIPYTHTQILIYTQVLAGCSPFHSHSLSRLSALHPGMAPHSTLEAGTRLGPNLSILSVHSGRLHATHDPTANHRRNHCGIRVSQSGVTPDSGRTHTATHAHKCHADTHTNATQTRMLT